MTNYAAHWGRSGYPQIAIRFGYGTPGHRTRRRAVTDALPG
ncbi:hypothetical protein Ari01nite_96510 [Paractinoplanes rishiriensis]|uniref:Uncharacterized protein n=1 Tax=Paractinoplanes rishiriensis TaxID=1050105 RepID=A0A919MW75_9ACTN|nr:hypothetical protein Ari01nite_96510 [Actinoplanes rishiriensis]